MESIRPVGQKIIVLPIETDSVHKTDSGLFAVTLEMEEAEVVEVSDELVHFYKPGDIVIYPKKTTTAAGVGVGLLYRGKPHLWLRQDIGEIWGIREIKPLIDKGDSL